MKHKLDVGLLSGEAHRFSICFDASNDVLRHRLSYEHVCIVRDYLDYRNAVLRGLMKCSAELIIAS